MLQKKERRRRLQKICKRKIIEKRGNRRLTYKVEKKNVKEIRKKCQIIEKRERLHREIQ